MSDVQLVPSSSVPPPPPPSSPATPSSAPPAAPPSNVVSSPTPTRIQVGERLLMKVFSMMALFFVATVFVQSFVIGPARVNGRSMEPTYTDDELFFVNKFVYLFSKPRRFDVVQVVEEREQKLIIKRIVGLPGEKVILKAGKIQLEDSQGKPIPFSEKRYLSDGVSSYVKGATTTLEWLVPEGSYFVLGDNRPRSSDSRSYGPVPRMKILGRVVGFEQKYRR